MTAVVAYHEAAHAIALVTRNIAIERCSIRPTRGSDGHVRPAVPIGRIEYCDLLLFLVAGAAAERRRTGAAAKFDVDDRQQAAIVAALRLNSEPDPAVRDHLRKYDLIADVLVLQHCQWIERCAAQLTRWGTLDDWDVRNLQ
jgi:hypothetical protein